MLISGEDCQVRARARTAEGCKASFFAVGCCSDASARRFFFTMGRVCIGSREEFKNV